MYNNYQVATHKYYMNYAIEETDLERQNLLAAFLDPQTFIALSGISLPEGANILDIGCGLGNSTALLRHCYRSSNITGLDENQMLIETACIHKKKQDEQMNFVVGNAKRLPFDENSFDFVFGRAILHHIPDSISVLRQMQKVCKPGGIVFVQEPDFACLASYPENQVYDQYLHMVQSAVADPFTGRKLLSYFNTCKFKNMGHRAQITLADHSTAVKKFYRMTAQAMEKTIMANRLMSKTTFESFIAEFIRIENDPDVIVLMPPNISVWGTKHF